MMYDSTRLVFHGSLWRAEEYFTGTEIQEFIFEFNVAPEPMLEAYLPMLQSGPEMLASFDAAQEWLETATWVRFRKIKSCHHS
jgi:hypothetical protein